MSTLALPFFIGSSLFLQVTMTAIKAWDCLQFVIVVFPDHTQLVFWMGSKFGKTGPGSAELATLEPLKKISIDL